MSGSRGLSPKLLALRPLGDAGEEDLPPDQGEEPARRVSRFSVNTWLDVPPTPVPAAEAQGRGFFGASESRPRRRLTAGPGRRYSSQSVIEGEWLESLRRPRNGREAEPLAAAITHFEEFMAPASAAVLQDRLQQISSRLELDLLELWRLDEESESEVYCTYAFGSAEVLARYPDLLLGHYPYNDICAAYSAELCQQALDADAKYCWRMRSNGSRSMDEVELSTATVSAGRGHGPAPVGPAATSIPPRQTARASEPSCSIRTQSPRWAKLGDISGPMFSVTSWRRLPAVLMIAAAPAWSL